MPTAACPPARPLFSPPAVVGEQKGKSNQSSRQPAAKSRLEVAQNVLGDRVPTQNVVVVKIAPFAHVPCGAEAAGDQLRRNVAWLSWCNVMV